uniref:hypothetical protein n=1 Tax=Conidiobolus lichenicola TaxID=1167816 RepID=UPI001D11A79C|nr:hypothetical protein LK371_mgp07 [Conidiobolus lichenicola]QZZ81320.1 hypothetical protein [Conidiobolus lichenicola]
MSKRLYETFKVIGPITVILLGQNINEQIKHKHNSTLQERENYLKKYEIDSKERIVKMQMESNERIAKHKIDSGNDINNVSDSTTIKSINENGYFDDIINYIDNLMGSFNEIQLYGLMFFILTALVLIFIIFIFIDSYVNNLLDKYNTKDDLTFLNRIKNLFINFNIYVFKGYNIYSIIIVLLTLIYMLFFSFSMIYFV